MTVVFSEAVLKEPDLSRSKPKPLPSVPPRQAVEFSVFAPDAVTPGAQFLLDVWAHRSDQFSEVLARAQELESTTLVGRKTGVSVPVGEVLTITITSEEMDVLSPLDSIVWNDTPANASFVLSVRRGTTASSCRGSAVIRWRGIRLAQVTFLVPVRARAEDRRERANLHDWILRTAFASYASEDRAEVLARIQGMKKIAPQLDIFIDVLSLRSGENWRELLNEYVPTKDTFFLFWSEPASLSKWVETEWRLALDRRGLRYIDPVPLVDPDLVPPPAELQTRHFSDAYLAHIEYERMKKQLLHSRTQAASSE